MIGSVPVAVEMAFGVRPGTVPGSGDWVDVTDSIDLTSSSSAILASTGRRTPRAGITPGTLSLTLENADGRYNPRNASGPYYGDLVNGTPVRVLVGDAFPYLSQTGASSGAATIAADASHDGAAFQVDLTFRSDFSLDSNTAGRTIAGRSSAQWYILWRYDSTGTGIWANTEPIIEASYWKGSAGYTVRCTIDDLGIVPGEWADLSVEFDASGITITGPAGAATPFDVVGTPGSIASGPTETTLLLSYGSSNTGLGGDLSALTVTVDSVLVADLNLAGMSDATDTSWTNTYGDTVTRASSSSPAYSGGTASTRWSGWVDSGWPQTITSRRPTVTITAHDILGLMAQGDAPTSAFDALLRTYTPQPDHWWRPGPTGWIDAVTGITMRHTGLMEQPSGQNSAIIVGEPAPWGQAEATGFGICEDDSVRLDSGATDITILARIQLATIAERTVNSVAESVIIIDQAEATGFSPVRVTVSTGSIDVLAIDADGLRQSYTAEPNQTIRLMDGRPHTVMVHIPADTGDISVWIDGRALQLTHDDTAGSYTLAPSDLYLGYAGPEVASKKAYQGYIDPLIIWRDHGGTADELHELAVDAHEAATVGLANRRLDQRVSALVAAYGLTAHQGALDTSGIVTQQSYRKDAPLRLLQAIEDTEQGRVWVDHDGELRFSARSWAWDDTVSNTVQIEFSDDPTLLDAGAHEMLEGGTVISDDPLNIVNVAAVTSTFGRQQTVEDATSIALYGRRNTLQLSGLLHSSDRQSRSIAEWLLLSQGDPQIQCRQLQFRVEDDPDVLTPIAAAIEEGWLVRIEKSTTAETLDMQAHVIGVSHEFRFTGWTLTLTLDATRTGYSFFKWGTSNWGGSAGWSF